MLYAAISQGWYFACSARYMASMYMDQPQLDN